MPSERTSGIILRTRPLTDTSLIVQWLTPDLGRIATVAKGARRPKSPFRGQIDLFYSADFSFMRSARSQLHTLREVSLLEAHAVLRQGIERLEQAAYCAKLIEQSTETETPIPVIFEDFTKLIQLLTQHPTRPQNVFAFEVKLLNELGLAPEQTQKSLSPVSAALLEQLGVLEWEKIGALELQPRQVAELRHFLHGFIIYHLERIPSGRNRALGVGV